MKRRNFLLHMVVSGMLMLLGIQTVLLAHDNPSNVSMCADACSKHYDSNSTGYQDCFKDCLKNNGTKV